MDNEIIEKDIEKEKEKEYKLLKEFYDKIKAVIRNTGRSNILTKSQIQDVIDEFEEEIE